MNKGCSVHIVRYYSVLKRNGILIYAITWVDLETLFLVKQDRHGRTNII